VAGASVSHILLLSGGGSVAAGSGPLVPRVAPLSGGCVLVSLPAVATVRRSCALRLLVGMMGVLVSWRLPGCVGGGGG
jgi:hypothetical protein